jgi:hypothetical protein
MKIGPCRRTIQFVLYSTTRHHEGRGLGFHGLRHFWTRFVWSFGYFFSDFISH